MVERGAVMTVKLSTEERKTLEKAAQGFPVSTWARVKLLELAEKEIRAKEMLERSATGDPETDRWLNRLASQVRKHNVTPYRTAGGGFGFTCYDCGQLWSPNILKGGKWPRGYWKCPRGCNA